jgi:hypothetical protein
LPSSDLRLSFSGDDGNTERLFTLSGKTQCAAVEVNEIPADSSGRSFSLKMSDGRVFYFWCSEKSKLLGIELLAKVYTTASWAMKCMHIHMHRMVRINLALKLTYDDCRDTANNFHGHFLKEKMINSTLHQL